MPEPRDPANVMAAGTGAHGNGLRSEFFSDREQSFRNLIKRPVPGNSFPFSGAPRADPPHWVFQSVRMIDEIERDGSDRAQPAVIERRFAVTFDLDQAIIANVQQYPAATVTATADALEDGCHVIHSNDTFSFSSSAALALRSMTISLASWRRLHAARQNAMFDPGRP